MALRTLTDEELVRQCASSEDDALWQEFSRRFHRTIFLTVYRTLGRFTPPSDGVCDDLVQEVYLKLFERRAMFSGFVADHEFATAGYVKLITANLVIDHLRRQQSQKRGPGLGVVSLDGDSAPQLADAPEGDAALLFDDIHRALRAVCSEPRDRQVFWLYYRVGLTARAIAAIPAVGLTTKGVESTLFRVTRLIRERLHAKNRPAGTKG